MLTKKHDEIFLFSDGSYQEYPNFIDRSDVEIIGKDDYNPNPHVDELDQAALIEHLWVKAELYDVQLELMYHWTDDRRATSTLDLWKSYARQLRDYTTTDATGKLSVCGELRPVKPI
jgi:hypothetical protein